MFRDSRRSMQRWAAAVATVAAASTLSPAPSAAPGRLTSRFWTPDPSAWKMAGPEPFPEDEALKDRPDFGIAFSGGGTRAAAATIGQLRGLHHNGWLEKVKYITAVSGGSWTAIPFVYSSKTPDELLGRTRQVGDLNKAFLETEPPAGSLSLSVVKSKLGAHSAVEAAEFVARRRAARAESPAILRALVDHLIPGGTDR